MRRLLTLCLLLLTGFSLVSPLLASVTARGDAGVPMCCRKGGAHHCLGAMGLRDGGGVAFSAVPTRCAEFPKATAPSHRSDLMLADAMPYLSDAVSLPSLQWQAEVRARIALDRARQKRGPPALLS